MELVDYLRAALGRHWLPGTWDCCFFPGEWVAAWGLGDPLAEWRGRYSTDLGGMRFIQEAGGLLSLWRRGLSSISIPQVDEPSAGDVGVIEGVTAIGPEPVGAIFTGERWAVCARSGLVFTPARHLAIWGRGYG